MMYMHQDSPPSCACTTLRKAARAVARVYDEALAESGMTTAQFSILRTVAPAEPMPLSRIADELVMDRTSLYRAVAPLEAKGWVRIEPGQGKAKRVTLTPAGREAIAAAVPAWEAVQRRITGGMSPDLWGNLGTALRALTEAAQRAGR